MTDKHEHLDEGTIHAWLDGALPPDESARIERWAGACAECAALVAEARGLVAASSRILSSLDAVPGGVIPGADAGTDQLAALRARRRETSRRWWSDRRILAAASLVFVAGISSLVLRNAGDSEVAGSEQTDAVQAARDSAVSMTAAPTAAPPPAPARANNAPARSEKAEISAPLRDAAQLRVAERRATDSTAVQKVVAPEEVRRDAAAANEAGRADGVLPQRTVDSLRVASREAARSAFEPPLQQGTAAPGQQSLRQRAVESRPAAPPSVGGTGAPLRPVITTGVSAAAPAADMAQISGCYRLQRPGTQGGGPAIIADSVQLLNEFSRERTDPTWYRARAAGWSGDTSLVWRADSSTVELRSRVPSNPLAVRFSITGLPLPLRPEAGVRAVVAVRIRCH